MTIEQLQPLLEDAVYA
ncbi:hypothetical protein MH131_17500, partial [Bacillus safensis]|nr:hypothetical protein [Bacillus safensis]